MSQFAFIPWVKNALAAKAAVDNTRLVLPLNLNLAVAGAAPSSTTVTVNADLHGPGSVIGLNPESVLKSLPPDGEQQYPALLVAALEFYEEDLPWRYSPPPPGGSNPAHAAPWCCLLVLEDGSTEYQTVEQGTRPLPTIQVPDEANFPPADQLWLWAHVQVNQSLAGTSTANFLHDTLPDNPDLAFSRIMSARRLKPNTAYRAFLVPSLEAGRQAGLGLPVTAIVTAPSWTSSMGERLFPVYYQWAFRTGEAGDFESLARRLRPVSLPDFGSQPMTVKLPLGGQGVARTGSWVVNLPGVLRPLTTVPPAPSELVQELYEELAPALTPVALPGTPARRNRPAVTPPVYGRAYASAAQLPNPGTNPPSGWFSQTNLDPRYRAVAGIGSQLLQDNQEAYTARAWEQVRDIIVANTNLRGMQSGVRTTSALRSQHLPLTGGGGSFRAAGGSAAKSSSPAIVGPTQPPAELQSMENYGLHLTGLAFARVLVPGTGGDGPDLTVQELIRQSSTPLAAFSPAFRRITKPFGRYQTSLAGRPRRPTDPTLTSPATTLLERGTTLAQRDTLLTLLNEGKITAAIPKPNNIRAYQFDDERVDKALSSTNEPPSKLWVLQQLPDQSTPTYASYGPESSQYEAFSTAYASFHKVRFNTADTERPALDLDQVKQALIEATRPEPVYLARAQKALRSVPHYGAYDASSSLLSAPNSQARGMAITATTTANPAPSLTELKPVMAYPVFKDPMGEILRTKHPDLFLPGVEDFPANGLTVLEVNREFIEAYLVGLNHALGSELLWRGFPTDLRGSYFRQFWDVSDLLSTSTTDGQIAADLAAAEEALRDVAPLDEWQQQALGANAPGTGPPEGIRLAVRADLLLRYPTTVISALPAKKVAGSATELEPDFTADYVYPTRRMTLGQDILVLSFPILKADAIGQGGTNPNPDGYFFLFQERPGEPHFGLDDWEGTTPLSFPPASWDDLSWQHLQAAEGAMVTIPMTAPASGVTLSPFTTIADSAKLAYAFFQQPFLVAIHTREMIPH